MVASVAVQKSASLSPRVRDADFWTKATLDQWVCQCPFDSEVRNVAPQNATNFGIRTLGPGQMGGLQSPQAIKRLAKSGSSSPLPARRKLASASPVRTSQSSN